MFQGSWMGLADMFFEVPLMGVITLTTWLLLFFSLCLSALVGGPQERVNIYSAMQFALHIKVIHFLFSTNAVSYGAL